ncbi:MAG: tRNA (N6-isopentenyl adenosine(37)-C2)-methylthiotransferase MiaB, partial [Patescibacteria group bacterium]
MKTYHIITIGCQMNVSDSERVASYLENLGYSWTDDKNNSDVVITTTCGVRQSAENRIYSLIPDIKKNNPACKVVLTGCLSDRPDVQRRLKDDVDIWMPIAKLETLAVELGEEKSELPESGSLSGYLKIQPKYQSTFSAFVQIGNGCNNFCTYCVVPYARGRETYREAAEIL